MKITKRQLKRIIREAWTQADTSAANAAGWQVPGVTPDPYKFVMSHASRIFGDVPLDEEMDGNIVIVVEPKDAELKYNEWIQIFPDGIMIEDGIATGVYPE